MAGNGGAERPLCRCHGEPMDRGSGRNRTGRCAVKRRAQRRARYAANAEAAIYVRVRQKQRARIERKRQRIKELEARLAEENARGA